MDSERLKEMRINTDTHGLEPQDYKALQYLGRTADPINEMYSAQTGSTSDAVYPPDMTHEAMCADRRWKWDQDKFNDPLTQVRKGKNGLVAVSYSLAYSRQLNEAAVLLDRAAACISHQALRDFLHSRAKALLDNKYDVSDRLWSRIDRAPIEVIIGPYPDSFDATLRLKSLFGLIAGPVLAGETAMFRDYPEYSEDYQRQVLAKQYPSLYKLGIPLQSVTVIEQHFAGGAALTNNSLIGGLRTILVQNLADAEFNGITKPLAHALFKEDDAAITATSIAKSLVAQGLGGGIGFNFRSGFGLIGRVLHQVKSLALGQSFDCFLARESNSHTTRAATLIPLLRCINTARIWRANMMSDIAQLFLFNFMAEHQAIEVSTDGVAIDTQKADLAFNILLKELENLAKLNNDNLRQKNGKNLIRRYNGFRSETKLIQKLAGNIPDQILPIFHD